MQENPFQSPTIDSVPFQSGLARVTSPASAYRLWRGFLVAPAIVPISLAIAMSSIGVTIAVFGDAAVPASFPILLVTIMTVGLGASYLAAVLVGLPIVLYLRRQNRLSGVVLHGASLIVAVIFSLVFSLLTTSGTWATWFVSLGLVFFSVAPLILLSTTVFWLLVRDSA